MRGRLALRCSIPLNLTFSPSRFAGTNLMAARLDMACSRLVHDQWAAGLDSARVGNGDRQIGHTFFSFCSWSLEHAAWHTTGVLWNIFFPPGRLVVVNLRSIMPCRFHTASGGQTIGGS